MTPRDGALTGAVIGLLTAFVADDTRHVSGILTLTALGLVLGAAAAGARRPQDFKKALFESAPRR